MDMRKKSVRSLEDLTKDVENLQTAYHRLAVNVQTEMQAIRERLDRLEAESDTAHNEAS